MIILLIALGSRVIYKEDTVVIEGTLKLNDSTDFVNHAVTTTYIDFPSGFTKDNCFLAAPIGTKVLNNDMGFAYGTVPDFNASAMSNNLIPCSIVLGNKNGKIELRADNIYEDVTLTYQIVLTKK